MHTVMQEIAGKFLQAERALKRDEKGTAFNWKAEAEEFARQHMPSGSGIDCGTTLDVDKSRSDRLVFHFSFHHMNDVGMYCKWTEHSLIVTPSLVTGFDMHITGQDYRDVKDYLYEVYSAALTEEWHPAPQPS